MKKHHFTLKETQNCKLFLYIYIYDLCSIGQERHCAEPATLHQIPVTEKKCLLVLPNISLPLYVQHDLHPMILRYICRDSNFQTSLPHVHLFIISFFLSYLN